MAEMTFVESVKTCFGKYAEFKGRASRAEYWWFILFLVLASGVGAALGERMQAAAMLVSFLPAISVTVRRLHDLGKSGWWYWLGLIPLVGAIILLVWFCRKGAAEPNDFGPDPLT